MAHPIESLEPRTLFAAASAAVGVATLDDAGVLVVKGTPGADTIAVRHVGRRIEVTVKTKPATTGWSFEADAVDLVRVNGRGDYDVLDLDAATQPITHDTGVEARVATLPSGRRVRDTHATALPGVYAGDPAKWLDRSARQIADAAHGHAPVVLLGDSMMAYFKETGAASYAKAFGRHALDLGLPGDTTAQLLYRVEKQGLLDRLSADTVVLHVGTNNVKLTDDALAITHGIGTVLAAVRARLPKAKVLLLGLLPQQDASNDRVIARVNARLPKLAGGKFVRLLPAADRFTGDTARARYYRVNNIHLNAHGYAAWASLIGPALAELRDGQ